MANKNSDSPNSVRILIGLVLAEGICVAAFTVELLRAFSGNELSWAYVFEWPFFGGYAIYLWRRLSGHEGHQWRKRSSARSKEQDVDEDKAMERWNEYLEQVHERESKRKNLRS